MMVFISKFCAGVNCNICGKKAAHKVAEEVQSDDPNPDRHELTAYVCQLCFEMIMGPAARQREGDEDLRN